MVKKEMKLNIYESHMYIGIHKIVHVRIHMNISMVHFIKQKSQHDAGACLSTVAADIISGVRHQPLFLRSWTFVPCGRTAIVARLGATRGEKDGAFPRSENIVFCEGGG